MSLTRVGTIREWYGYVEPRPFSRFTADPNEQEANRDWEQRALAWGEQHVDEHGYIDHDIRKSLQAAP